MTDRNIVADYGGDTFIDVDHGAVLYIAAFTDPDHIIVGAKYRTEPDTGSGSDLHITNHTGTIGDEDVISDSGCLLTKGIDHSAAPSVRSAG